MSKAKAVIIYNCHFSYCRKLCPTPIKVREHLEAVHDISLQNVTRQRGKPPQDPDWQFISSEADSENKFPRRYGCSGCYKSFESRDTLSTHVEALHTELTLAESAQVKQSSRRNNEALQSPSISDGLDQASDVRLKKRKGYESPTGGESTRRHRNLLEEFTTSLEENPFDDDDDPLISVPTDFGFEFKRESEEEWILNGEDVLESIYEYQNASLRYLRQKTAINENMERILSLSSIILLRDQSTVFDDSSDQLQLREAIKLEQLSAMQTEMNEDEKFDLESLRNILKMTLKENNRTLGLKAIDATEMKELSRLKELTRYIIGHHPFRKVSHVGRKSETETQCTTAHLYPFMLSMYGDPDRFPVVFGNSSSTASAARINGKYQARQPDGIIQAVHGHATFEAGYMENKFNNATKANVAKDLMRLCRFAKDSLDLLRRRSVNPDLFVTLNQIVDHHVDLFVSKRKADGFTLVTQVGSYELPCTIRDMLAFLDDYEGLHMFFKASLDCCAKFRQVLVTNPPTLADTTYRQCVSTPELKKFLLL